MISVKKKGILFLAIFDKFESRKHTMNDYIKCVYFLSIRFKKIFVTNDLHCIILHLKKHISSSVACILLLYGNQYL